MSAMLDKSAYGYRFKIFITINRLLYINEIKLYAKNELDNLLIYLTWVLSSDIGMTIDLAKYGCLIVKRGKVKNSSGVSLPEGQVNDIDECYKCLGILQMKVVQAKYKNHGNYRQRLQKARRD